MTNRLRSISDDRDWLGRPGAVNQRSTKRSFASAGITWRRCWTMHCTASSQLHYEWGAVETGFRRTRIEAVDDLTAYRCVASVTDNLFTEIQCNEQVYPSFADGRKQPLCLTRCKESIHNRSALLSGSRSKIVLRENIRELSLGQCLLWRKTSGKWSYGYLQANATAHRRASNLCCHVARYRTIKAAHLDYALEVFHPAAGRCISRMCVLLTLLPKCHRDMLKRQLDDVL
jgi:hypothetical protein